jgi:phospholipase/carboxylesterase
MNTALRDLRSPDFASHVGEYRAVMLFLHGFGSSERDLAGLAPALDLALPWASLRAPHEVGNGGAAWFEIVTPGNPDPQPVAEATDAVWAWVDEQVDPDARVIPVGFSQGGLMASQLLRTRPERVLAPVVLGGFVQGSPQPGDDTLATTRPPLFWGRGAEDRVIAPAAIARTAAYLPQHSNLVEEIYPGLGHGISAAEVDDVRGFLRAHVGAHAVGAR